MGRLLQRLEAAAIALAVLMTVSAAGCFLSRNTPTPSPVEVVAAVDAGTPVAEMAPVVEPELPSVGEQVVQEASRWLGRKSLRSVIRGMKDDCIGLIRFVYTRAGVPLDEHAFVRSAKNAVNGLYLRFRSAGLVRLENPLPGDLVFFRDTYDVNRDGRRNDGMTHIGIVEEVQEDGTVLFIHRERRGVVQSAANPLKPRQLEDSEGRKLNDYIRRESLEHRGYLAGELVAGFVSPNQVQDWAYQARLDEKSPTK
jgi:hypothetical protein